MPLDDDDRYSTSEQPVDWGGVNFEDTDVSEILPYIVACHSDASHALKFTGDPDIQAAEIAPIVLQKMRNLGGGLSNDVRNAVREALNHLLMTDPNVSCYFGRE